MNAIATPDLLPETAYFVPLTSIGLLTAEGDDAASFIHGQFSNDIANLGKNAARLAAYCNPQGRILALFHIWKTGKKVWMMHSADILPALIKRLQIYVMRAKVKLADETGKYCFYGAGGKKAEAVLKKLFPELPEGPFARTENPGGVLIRSGDAFGEPRYLLAVPADKAPLTESILSGGLSRCEENVWRLGDIEAGLPEITAPVQDMFIPQMVNLEETGGLSFQKGCYPGQEVIARSQYRGRIKRKMYRGYTELPDKGLSLLLGAGTEVFDSEGRSCGTVVQSALRSGNRLDLLAVVMMDAPANTRVHAGSADGPEIIWEALPYPFAVQK